jgi:branched-subunit amino acid aminotransferase/4-amino-4-deoxychorismate lyase
MATVWLNGAFVEMEAARVSAFDAGFTHAVGLFETMLGGVGGGGDGVGGGGDAWVVGMAEHLERLRESARVLGLASHVNTSAMGDAVLRAVEESGLGRARVRVTFTGGDLNMLSRAWNKATRANEDEGAQGKTDSGTDPTLLIVVQEATRYPEEMYERGVAVTIADMRANPLDPLAAHKTLNYWGRLRELQIAGSKGAAEALVLQVTNHLAGGCVSNCLLVKGDRIVTPIAREEEEQGTMPSPVLPGVVRSWALEWAGDRGLGVERRMVAINDVLEADEVLLTNSSWGVLPVVKIEREAVGDGVVGKIGKDLRRAWEEMIADESGM